MVITKDNAHEYLNVLLRMKWERDPDPGDSRLGDAIAKRLPWIITAVDGDTFILECPRAALGPYPYEALSRLGLTYSLHTFEADDCTNKGRKECWKCSCATEKKRDFLTFEVRDMCPRCKI